jgi:predicted nucleotidyltransferase component of viral defense system
MDKTEELLAKLMGQLAERFKNQLILKGGMLLRLLNSARRTQDLDYSWVRTKKRTLLGLEIKTALEEMEGIRVIDERTNSRGVFLTVRHEPSETIAKIEINVVSSSHLPPRPMSTAPLTNRYALRSHVIAAMDLSEALSHKIAAALERDLARDLYDLAQMEPLTPFDPSTLKDRLAKLEVARSKPRRIGFREGAELLQGRLDRLTQKKVIDELSDAIPDGHLPGLETVIRASVSRIIQRMQSLES